jgi:hypothetical protein
VLTEIGCLFVFGVVLARRFLDGFGIDFEFDLLTYRHHARLQNFVVIDSVILAIQFRATPLRRCPTLSAATRGRYPKDSNLFS